MNARNKKWLGLGMFAFTLTALNGCQTYMPESGLTLPTGRYLQHPPQYIPPSPMFPLQKELSSMEASAAAAPQAGQGPAPRLGAPVGRGQ